MEAQERTETRKDEIRYRTDDQRRMVGKFLASRVVKTWKEDFADQDTGEIITVERNDILFEKGKYIDEDTAISIAFHIQCGDIADVEVSNQRRLAQPSKDYVLRPYKATAVVGNKRKSFILQAQSATAAIEVVTDYIELNFTSAFSVDSVKLMPGCHNSKRPLPPRRRGSGRRQRSRRGNPGRRGSPRRYEVLPH